MKLALLLLLALPLCAQQGSIDVLAVAKLAAHPKTTYRSIKTHPLAMLTGSLTLGAVNGLDYITTELGPGQHPNQFCEQIITTSVPCQLDKRKFDWLKGSIAIFDAVQWIPVFAFPDWKYQQDYQAVMVIADGALSVPMIKAVSGNLSALRKTGYLP